LISLVEKHVYVTNQKSKENNLYENEDILAPNT